MVFKQVRLLPRVQISYNKQYTLYNNLTNMLLSSKYLLILQMLINKVNKLIN